ncbi:hypothetical protein [Paenibacillus alvei]|uniref:hypothetical protein n=1 Tax=Paenibacillus alvei TaxID=44250 RepID=UPI0013DC9650|nr:hypothetical protein [Paenibacillus alvei]MBG9735798.1 hypothetical protein [Paenibacillus alvei]MBG9744343.1 hypothetical protein [Paenibacillus alvei]MCY9577924.1 hypothetical protein [Paenibacillus alvei]MCY9587309.1 hypothetical protein [Paenibacillus alvei]NEZ45347.1 hypothetical protein [Paenibacillus alvei]
MMDVGLKAWAEIVRRVYPDLPILRDRSRWMAGDFERPSVFIETDLVSDRVHTPQADRIIEDVGLVFHFDKERVAEEDEGEPIPYDLTPFFTYLRQKRFCVASERFGIMMVIEPPQLRPKADQVEVTCRYSYLLHVPKLLVNDDGSPIERINKFYISHNGEEFDA